MTGIAVYVEGGGNTADTRASFRLAMNEFLKGLKEAARSRRLTWKVVPCGDHDETKEKFLRQRQIEPATLSVLLVDSETAVEGTAIKHLTDRGWTLDGVAADDVHLMVRIMETWLAADSAALEEFYGSGFRNRALPAHFDLEQVSKRDVLAGLVSATRGTGKGPYHKTRHLAVLGRLDASRVRSRCRHCDRFWKRIELAVR